MNASTKMSPCEISIKAVLDSDASLEAKGWLVLQEVKKHRNTEDGADMARVCEMIDRDGFFHNTKTNREPTGYKSWEELNRYLHKLASRPYTFRVNQDEYSHAYWAMYDRVLRTWPRHPVTENVVFLDIDGVLQGDWTWPAKGFYAANCHRFLWNPRETVSKFDQHFLWFLRGLSEVVPNLSFVLCSTWRSIIRNAYLDMFAHYTELPISGCTGRADTREDECLQFLCDNDIVRKSITIDDEIYDVGERLRQDPMYNDAGYAIENTHFRIDNINGPQVSQMKAMCEVFGVTFYDVCRHNSVKRGDKKLK